ncbi:non-specific lipid transfer protein GPI-anchored 5-like isoform X2 [Hevea brasiliensis]|uniref:non-specific lipid transfer protein GPI-anchored 5-like isoform X2 n=1 Tax=Hevea brasiliensis TaxID=3981 RepID=UPI000B772982|nr:non-specific lipid transfer protein GPI-anchored 5-like isoform X2 [Hevea brasiliensis]
MASRGINSTSLVVLLVAMLWARATAQSGCTSVIIGLAPCLNYVTGSSSTPSSSCCSQLASVVQSQPQCLCSVLNGGGASLGVTINQTLALALPGACHVKTPPVSKCNDVGSPESSPADSSVTGGSKAVPATETSSANGFKMDMTFQLVLFAMFMASCASTISSF